MLTSSKMTMFIKQSLKSQEKFKELESMYQNAIYICISWYSKIWWFSVKKWWCQQNSRGVSRDSNNFRIFFRWGITASSFIIAGYVWQILGRGTFLPPSPIREHPRKIASSIGLITDNIVIWLCLGIATSPF